MYQNQTTGNAACVGTYHGKDEHSFQSVQVISCRAMFYPVEFNQPAMIKTGGRSSNKKIKKKHSHCSPSGALSSLKLNPKEKV